MDNITIPDNEKRILQLKMLFITPNALLRLMGATIIWKILGLVLGFVFNMAIFVLFVTIFFIIGWLGPYWQPAYSVLYWIVGNKSISPKLAPVRLGLWQFISIAIRLIFLAIMLFAAFKIAVQ